MPTSIGIGPTKTLAKGSLGIFDLGQPSVQEHVLSKFLVEDFWGVGRGTMDKLHALGIHSAQQFRQADVSLVRRQLGVVGEGTHLELQGISCLPLEEAVLPQSVCRSRSFPIIITDLQLLSEALSTHVSAAAERLRKETCYAQALTVFLESLGDPTKEVRDHFSTTFTLPSPTNDTSLLIYAAKQCLKQLFRPQHRYKKCGVVLLDLLPEMEVCLDLFTKRPNDKRKLFLETMDIVNQKLGKKTLFFAASGVDSSWEMNSKNRSPRYTTAWDELSEAKA
jgi:DNA polymerase V